ncbi:MAG: tetratricopeptide repeat protein [Deltaproteobacteria bacterium]|nr:tetratricopeptide repeat protein [Deltaproteobacteria bacterium]
MKKIIVFFSLFLLFATGAAASDASKKLVQKGYKQLAQNQFEPALKNFEAASKVDSIDGEALFFQGVTLNRLGRFSEAAQKLDAASQYGTHSDWNFEMGLSQYGMGDNQKAESYFKKSRKDNPARKKDADFYLSKMEAQEQKAEEGPKNWNVYGQVEGTYNTNALNLGNGVTRPANISRQESGLAGLTAGGSYRFDISDSSQVTLGDRALANIYEVNSGLNLFDNYTTLQYRHAFDPKKVLGITFSNDFSVVQTAKFRNQIGFQPVFGWRLADWFATEIGYLFNFGTYFFPSNFAQNRSGTVHTALMNNYISISDTDWRFRLNYSHIWNRSYGSDFVYQGNNLIFAVNHPLFWKVAAELYFSQAWNGYDNVNSLTANTRRSDNISNVWLTFNRPLGEKFGAYLRGGYTRNGSNIAVYNYRAYQGTLGFSGNF